MICCFMNFHKQENAQNLMKHFDDEIEKAIIFGCNLFVSGNRHSEDKIFKDRVLRASKFYAKGQIEYLEVDTDNEDILKKFFIDIADWEVYSYEY